MKFLFFEIKLIKKKPDLTVEQIQNRCFWNQQGCLEAENYLTCAQELDTKRDTVNIDCIDILIEGLIIAAIISYGRQFVESRGGENAAPICKLNAGEAFRNDQNTIALHKLIKEKRNRVVAHADSEYRQTELMQAGDIDRHLAAPENAVARRIWGADYLDGIDITLFKNLSHAAEQYFIRLTY